MTEQTRVVVQGALGRMGQEIIATLAKEPDMLPAGGADKFAKEDSLVLPGGSGTIPLSTSPHRRYRGSGRCGRLHQRRRRR